MGLCRRACLCSLRSSLARFARNAVVLLFRCVVYGSYVSFFASTSHWLASLAAAASRPLRASWGHKSVVKMQWESSKSATSLPKCGNGKQASGGMTAECLEFWSAKFNVDAERKKMKEFADVVDSITKCGKLPPTAPLRCPQVRSGALRCAQVRSGALRCPFQVRLGALRCPQVRSGALRCAQMPSGALRCA